MIDFVLDAGGEQAVGVVFLRLAVKVEIFDLDPLRPLDLFGPYVLAFLGEGGAPRASQPAPAASDPTARV